MPLRERGKLDGAASPDAGGDRISALPDDALHHILSFLPAEDAVRTCVLARRWEHLWKSATGLRIGFSHGDTPPSVDNIRNFVNHLLLLRKRDSCLHTCELRIQPDDGDDQLDEEEIQDDQLDEEEIQDHYHSFPEELIQDLELWIRHILDREVRMLRLELQDYCGDVFHLGRPVSHHLKTLALIGVCLDSRWNISNCPNLEHLEIAKSLIEATQISSKALKHLSISDCFFDCMLDDCMRLHILICTPSLVSLRLDAHFCSVPVLGSMPSLKEAFARNRDEFNYSVCYGYKCFSCDVTPEESNYKNKCFLLQGLSEVENLTLMCDFDGVFFHRDLEWCPTFNNLRTLLLDEWWCKDPDFYGLNLILEHSPVLEKLNLHLFSMGPHYKVEMIGRYNQMERPATTILKHLKEIEVKCDVVDEQVHKVLKFLGTFGISFLFK